MTLLPQVRNQLDSAAHRQALRPRHAQAVGLANAARSARIPSLSSMVPAFAVIVALGIGGTAVALLTHHNTPAVERGVTAAQPPFVVVHDAGSRSTLSMYSPRTGKRVRTFASFSDMAFTNNGLAETPDGRDVYLTLFPRHHTRHFSLRITRIDVANGRQSFVANGAQPAISRDGRQLAYGAFPNGLTVRDLATGQTRTIKLPQLGSSAQLLNASIGWLGNGSQLAIVPAPAAWDLMGRPPHPRWCGTTQTHSVIVFVHVPAPPAPLTARCIHLAGPPLGPGAMALVQSPTNPEALLVATESRGDNTLIEQITSSGSTSRLQSIPDSLPDAFDPSGTQLLYLAGHNPPTLTKATINGSRLTNAQWRDRHVAVGALAW